MDYKLFSLQILSPDSTVYESKVKMVEVPASEGRIGIYAGHIPLTCILVPGILRIMEADGSEKWAEILEGFCEIFTENVLIFAETVKWAKMTAPSK